MLLSENVGNHLDMKVHVRMRKSTVIVVRITETELLVARKSHPVHIIEVSEHIVHLLGYVDARCRTERIDEIIFRKRITCKRIVHRPGSAATVLSGH